MRPSSSVGGGGSFRRSGGGETAQEDLGPGGLVQTPLNSSPLWLMLLRPGPVSVQMPPPRIQVASLWAPDQGAFSRSDSPAGGFRPLTYLCQRPALNLVGGEQNLS